MKIFFLKLPSDTISMCKVLPLDTLAYLSNWFVGSEPGERMNIIGVWAKLWVYNWCNVGMPNKFYFLINF